MVLNLFGVEALPRLSLLCQSLRLLLFIFIIIGIVLIAGGGPNSTGLYCQILARPRCLRKTCLQEFNLKNISAISRAAKGTFWRIAIFYITTVVTIGCLVPYNDPRLLSGSNSEDISASPFVIALSNTGSMGAKVSNFMNVVILVAVVSVCNSCVYASSRIIQALGASGQLPSVCSYMDRKGRPLVGIGISGAFGLLGFLVASKKEDEVFTWLFALCSISSFFTWFCICMSQIRFRMAMKAQGRSNDEIALQSHTGCLWWNFGGCVLNALLIAGEIYVSAAPVLVPPAPLKPSLNTV
nr:CIC_HP1_G0040610.mRNA.1.CDS.1 [Saccharomyces cerevisiae]